MPKVRPVSPQLSRPYLALRPQLPDKQPRQIAPIIFSTFASSQSMVGLVPGTLQTPACVLSTKQDSRYSGISAPAYFFKTVHFISPRLEPGLEPSIIGLGSSLTPKNS